MLFRSKRQNEYFRIISDEEQLIRSRFRKPRPGEPFKFLSSATIAQMISYGNRNITSRRVSLVMKAIGYRSERNSKGCFYRLYDMNPTEAQHEISALFAEEPERPEMPQDEAVEQGLPF